MEIDKFEYFLHRKTDQNINFLNQLKIRFELHNS